MIDEHDDGTVHIPVRVDGDDKASAGEPEHDAAAVEHPPTMDSGADTGDDEPQIVATGDTDDDDEPQIISIGDEEVEPSAPPIGEMLSTPRSRLSEMGREKLKLEDDVRKLQGEAYQAKIDARGLEEKIATFDDQLARRHAEFQNFRRRADKQREDSLRYANSDLLEELLPVLDNFERAMSSPPTKDSVEEFHKGVELIHKQLLDSLARFDLEAIEVVGQVFDPNFHEAVTRSASDTVPEDHVKTEMRRGYLLRDRLLRAAMVEVSAGPEHGAEVADEVADSMEPAPAGNSSGPPEDEGGPEASTEE